MKIVPWFNLVFFHVVIIVFLFFYPVFSIPSLVIFIPGCVLASSGLIYFTVVKKWSGDTKKSDGIWDSGPFAMVRHPFHGGVIIILIASMIEMILGLLKPHLLNTYVISACAILASALYLILFLGKKSIDQEKELIEMHGEKAYEYFEKVKARWIPFLI